MTTGYTQFYTNLGQIRNAGWEAALDLRPVAGKNFTWDVRGISTNNKNTVEELIPGIQSPVDGLTIEAGFPYGYLRGSILPAPRMELVINQTSGMPMLTLIMIWWEIQMLILNSITNTLP